MVSFGPTAWTIAKTAGELSKKLYELGKFIKDREVKQQMDEIFDRVLEQSASELKDENRELREKLRFKGDMKYEFRTAFWYHKAKSEQPFV